MPELKEETLMKKIRKWISILTAAMLAAIPVLATPVTSLAKEMEPEPEAQRGHNDQHRKRKPPQHFLRGAAVALFAERPDEHIVRRDQQKQQPRRVPKIKQNADGNIRDHHDQRKRELF